MSRSQGQKKLDELIAESRRIQDALIRVVVKLDVFAEQLTTEAAKLQEATGVEDERIPAGEASQSLARSGPVDPEGGGAEWGSDGGEA